MMEAAAMARPKQPSNMEVEPAVDLSLAIPFYNEEECLVPAMNAIVGALEEAGVSYELIFVDNGSVDRTLESMEAFQRMHPRIRVIHFDRNQGFGARSSDCRFST